MTIDLNNHELEMLEKALDCYEKDAGSGALFGGMLGMMLSPKEERAGEKKRFEQEMDKAQIEAHNRRVQTTLLRAKLYQAMARESEHVLEMQKG